MIKVIIFLYYLCKNVFSFSVSSSLKQNRSAKSDSSNSTRQVEEKTVTTTKVNTSKSSETASSFLDNSSRVTGVQDVLNRMRNADLGD